MDRGKLPTYRARVDMTLASGANSLKLLLFIIIYYYYLNITYYYFSLFLEVRTNLVLI